MATKLLSERYRVDLYGVLSCYDRIIITGNLHPLCYAKGMTKYLYAHNIRIFDYTEFAQPLRDAIRANAKALAKENYPFLDYFTRKSPVLHFHRNKRQRFDIQPSLQ